MKNLEMHRELMKSNNLEILIQQRDELLIQFSKLGRLNQVDKQILYEYNIKISELENQPLFEMLGNVFSPNKN